MLISVLVVWLKSIKEDSWFKNYLIAKSNFPIYIFFRYHKNAYMDQMNCTNSTLHGADNDLMVESWNFHDFFYMNSIPTGAWSVYICATIEIEVV